MFLATRCNGSRRLHRRRSSKHMQTWSNIKTTWLPRRHISLDHIQNALFIPKKILSSALRRLWSIALLSCFADVAHLHKAAVLLGCSVHCTLEGKTCYISVISERKAVFPRTTSKDRDTPYHPSMMCHFLIAAENPACRRFSPRRRPYPCASPYSHEPLLAPERHSTTTLARHPPRRSSLLLLQAERSLLAQASVVLPLWVGIFSSASTFPAGPAG